MTSTTSRRLMLLGAVALLAGCATNPPAVMAPTSAYEELEPVFAVSSAYEAISIRVSSNGCTTKADFTFYVERRGGGGAAVAFARTNPDNCRSFARGSQARHYLEAKVFHARHRRMGNDAYIYPPKS